MTERRRGLIAAVHTPMDADGALDLGRVPRQVELLIGSGIAGLYAVGSTGEGPSLTGAERRAVAEAFVEAAAGRAPVIVQVGHNALREASELAAHAQRIGASAISATPPAYFRPESIDTLVRCLAEIAHAAPDLPFYYYHIPQLTEVKLDMTELLGRAAEAIPTFRGIKYTAATLDEFQACADLDGGRFNMLYGRDEMLLGGLLAGADGAVGSTYNFALPLYQRLWAAFEAGEREEARRCQSQAVRMIRIIVGHGGVAALKAAMSLIGLDCGPPRLPLEPLTPGAMRSMRRELEAIGFFDFATSAAGSPASET